MTNNNKKYDLLAAGLLKTLEKTIPQLPLRRQFHFGERLYHISGKKKYLEYIRKFLISAYPLFQRDCQFLGNPSGEKEKGLKEIQRLSSLSPLKKPRWEFYRKNPQLKFYQSLIFLLAKFWEYQGKKILRFPSFYQTYLYFKNINWEKYLLDSKFILADPVQGINQIFWLKNLKLANLSSRFINLFFSLYPPNLVFKNPLAFHNQIYGYTHIIITDSNYYQKFPSSQKHSRVLNFLKKILPSVIKKKNLDLAAEIGCCFKLCRAFPQEIEKIKKILTQNINPKTNLLSPSFSNPSAFEHTHVLTAMVLLKWKRLYHSPKIDIKLNL